MLSLQEEREAWVHYGNLHVLELGGVPSSADMRRFAPQLWAEQTATPAVYFVYNDVGAPLDEYLKNPNRGYRIRVDERSTAPPTEPGAAPVDAAVARAENARKPALWEEAKARLKLPRLCFADTRGLSCHGIVPRRPPEL